MTNIIRTKTKAHGGITPAEKALMDEHSKLWISRAMRTAPIEPDQIIPAIEGLYAVAGLKKPRVVIVPSPMVMAFAYGASAAIWYGRKNAATYAATDAATYAATGEQFAALACYDLAGDLGIESARRWWIVMQGGNMWAGYDCYLTACRDILGLELTSHAGYAFWEQAAIHGGFRVMHEEFCMVSDFSETLRVDDQNRPHCEGGPSHRWRDGWSLYHWHGVKIPAGWIEDKQSLTAAIALGQENAELRRAACDIIGWDRILFQIGAKVVDEDGDPEIGTLLQGDLPDARGEKFLRVRCGTGRDFAIPVPPQMKTALEAQAWLWGETPTTFIRPEIRT